MYSSPHVFAVVRAADWTVRVSSALTTKLAHKLAYYVEAYSVRAHLPISGVSIHHITIFSDLLCTRTTLPLITNLLENTFIINDKGPKPAKIKT